VSFGFQIHHGLANTAKRDLVAPVKRIGDLIGGQAGLVSPILFGLFMIATGRGFRRVSSDAAYVLAMIGAFTFVFFVYSATRQRVEANWPAPAYIAAIPLLAAMPLTSRSRRWFEAGIWLALILSVAIYFHAAFGILPIPPRRDPLARSAGWRDLARATDAATARADSAVRSNGWIAADRYQDAAELAFQSPNHPIVFSLNFSGRSNQYDLWPGFAQRAHVGDNLVIALDETGETNPIVTRLAPFFRTVARDSLVDLRTRHGLVTQRRLWSLRGWIGGWPPRS
jgi:hypothetical protein